MSLKKDESLAKENIRCPEGVIKCLRFLILISIKQALYNVKKFSWKKEDRQGSSKLIVNT